MMEKSSNNPKKCFISEEDTSILLQRYPATSVLALLQEMSQVADAKIDWNKMVRKTATGITNAREYQMLWRHLAYQDCLLEKIENGAQPLDDDSDLECELEAFPAVSAEASAEAAACVKVLIASGLSSDPHGTNGSIVEAPLNITIPQSHASCTSSVKQGCSSTMRRKNITVPISVQKQQLPNSISCENLDNTGAATGNGANKRKRRPWSEQEDQELAEAVKQYGEGNWATLIKGPYKTDRTAGQLAQRWTVLKKKQGKPTPRPSSQLSEAQLAATRRAMSLALDMPMGDKSFKAGPSSHVAYRSTVHPSAPESSLVGSQSRAHVQQDPSPSAAQCPATAAGSSKSRVACKKTPTIKSLSPDSKVKATAVAAGARIATPSDAASLLIAAQSKNAVHIKSGGTSMMKPSIPGNVNQLPSNVHFIRTGLVNKPLSTYASRLGSSQEVVANSVKPEIAAVKSDPDAVIIDLGASSQVNHGTASNMTSKPDVKTTTDASAGHAARVVGKNDNSEASGSQAVSGSLTGQNQMNPSSFPSNGSNEKLDDKQTSFLGTHRNSVSGTVQPNSSSSRDAGIHGHWQGEGNDIKGANKLEPMDITVVK